VGFGLACQVQKKEGVQGLKDRPKSGRPPKLTPEIAVKIKKKLKESKQGWTTEQVNEMIVKDGGVRYHNIYIYIRYFTSGALSRRYQGRYMLILKASLYPDKKIHCCTCLRLFVLNKVDHISND
jgi:hypothetical protein